MSNLWETVQHSSTPLQAIIEKKTPWSWGQSQQHAFDLAKSIIASARVLIHYDPEKKIILSCDASPYGAGAVISHQTSEGEKPIPDLSPAEKNNSATSYNGHSK